MTEETYLEEELSAYTDALLSGQPMPPPADQPDLAGIVRALNRLAGPGIQPDETFRQRLRQQLRVQWTQEHGAPLSRSPYRRWRMLALVAGVAVIMLIAVLGTATRSDLSEDLRGTALGTGIWLAIAGAAVAIGGTLLWWGRRR